MVVHLQQQSDKQNYQQPCHMQYNRVVNSNQDNSHQTSMKNQSDPRQKQQRPIRQNRPHFPSRSKSVSPNQRQSRQYPARYTQSTQNCSNWVSDKSKGVDSIRQQVKHIDQQISDKRYHPAVNSIQEKNHHTSTRSQRERDRQRRQQITEQQKSRTYRRSKQQPFLDSSRELKERWEKQGARPKTSK